jgi:hypothetical protein
MTSEPGKSFNTDYSESDVLACVSSYATITGKNQPERVYVRIENKEKVSWLIDFGIIVTVAPIQIGTILLV